MPGAIGPHGPGQPAGPRVRVRIVPGAPEVAVAANGCASWSELAAVSRTCVACPELAETRTTVVVGDAPPGARLALVGEAPGADEDRSGRPFVGRAGQLLDSLLAEAGLDRAGVAVMNVLQCRPPGNRAPKPDEAARCSGWLGRKLAFADPELVVPLGLTATAWFLGRGVRLGQVRGTVHEVDGRRVLPTYHPSAAIRYGPAGEPMAALRADLELARTLLDEGRSR